MASLYALLKDDTLRVKARRNPDAWARFKVVMDGVDADRDSLSIAWAAYLNGYLACYSRFQYIIEEYRRHAI